MATMIRCAAPPCCSSSRILKSAWLKLEDTALSLADLSMLPYLRGGSVTPITTPNARRTRPNGSLLRTVTRVELIISLGASVRSFSLHRCLWFKAPFEPRSPREGYFSMPE
jgi:hypothetical protein